MPSNSVKPKNTGAVDLSVSVVTYAPNMDVFRRSIAHLRSSVANAVESGAVGRVKLLVVEHGPDAGAYDQLSNVLRTE
jgi:hypothetical protein